MTYKEAADRIRNHNNIHRFSERGAVLITQALDIAVEVLETIPEADVQPVTHTQNMSTVAFCDRFICKNCDIHLENWVKVVIDPDDGDELHYEYEFKFCPECGARIVEVEV